VDADGRLLCVECKIPYTASAFIGEAKQDVFESLQQLRALKFKEKEVKIELEQQEIRLRAEFDAVLAKSGEEREVHQLVLKVREDVLNLKCPGCHAVFLDFDGCFALTCSVNTCKMAFCAWCLKACGDDAHAHVQKCPLGKGQGLFGKIDVFHAHHVVRRSGIISQLLQDKSEHIQKLVCEALSKEILDLGIKLPPHLMRFVIPQVKPVAAKAKRVRGRPPAPIQQPVSEVIEVEGNSPAIEERIRNNIASGERNALRGAAGVVDLI
jgi:hypothetical protein